MLEVIWDISGYLGIRRLVEDYFLRRLSETFSKEKALSTSFSDAYPHSDDIGDLGERPAGKDILSALITTGSCMLKEGVYDFQLEGFCLRAGGYAPVKGDGYLAAPVKGSKSDIISAILRESPKYPALSQHSVQILLWAVESGARYTALSGEARYAADSILTEKQKDKLGKSFWDAIPRPLQNLITEELYSRLPDSIRRPLKIYRAIKYRIESAEMYSEIERLAVMFNPPASSSVIKSGTWSSIPGGYFIRAFPSGYTAARLQVFIPSSAGTVTFSLADFILVPADTTGGVGRQRLGLRAVWKLRDEQFMPPPPPPHREYGSDIEVVFKEGEGLSNLRVIDALKKLAGLLGADKVRVSGGDRSFEEYKKIKGNDKTYEDYLKNRHGVGQGYIAADCQFFANGRPIPHDKAADAATLIKEIGGIGLYDGHIHIDLRPRLPGDIPTRWDKRGAK